MRSKDEAIDDFLAALAHAYKEMDLRTFEISADIFHYDPIIAETWTRGHTLPMIEAASRLSSREVARLMHDNPSAMRALMQFDLLMAKEAKLGPAVYLRIFDFYTEMLTAICLSDPYAKDGTNIIHTSEEVAQLVALCEKGGRDEARALGKLANACYSLSHGLYCDMNPQLLYDNFGPYSQPDGELFVQKIFHNLRPVELWPETAQLPVDGIDVGVLLEGVTMTMDATTHAVFIGNQVEALRAWSCSANGKRLTIPEIESLRAAIEKVAISIFEQTKAFTIPKRKEFYCYQKAWGYKKLFDGLVLDWRPSIDVLKAMKGDALFDNWNVDWGTGFVGCTVEDLFDPRMEIPKEAFKS